ncbi:hypothetical protein Tco_1298274, partial [Tanacetum coccineum]
MLKPVTHPKAPTNQKTKKKRIPSSCQPKSPYKARVSLLKKQVAKTQHAEVTVATPDAPKSLEASELAEEQVNQPLTAKTEKVPDIIVEENVEKEDAEDHSSDIPTIRFVRFFQASQIIQTKVDSLKDAEADLMGSGPMDIDFKYELESMPDDDLQSLLGFETPISDDSCHEVSHSEHTLWKKTAFAEFQSLSAHLDHVCEEVSLLHYKVEEMESSIIQKLPGLLSDALKDCFPQLLRESLMTFVPTITESVAEEQAQFKKQALTKVLKTEMRESVSSKVSSEVREILEQAVIMNDHAEEEKKNAAILDASQGEHKSDHADTSFINEEKALVIRQTVKTTEDDTDYDELDKGPLSKRFKIITPIPNFPTPTPLCSIPPEHVMKPVPQQESVQEFTDKLFQTTSSNFLPSPLRELTPPRYTSKGKEVATEEPNTELINYMEEGGSNKEMKRWEELKEQENKSEEELKKLLNSATFKAQALKWEEHEKKKSKMLSEFNTCNFERTSPLPITKISYIINSQKEPTMRITKDNDPLNLTVYPNFRLKMLGFNEWLEVHYLASKKIGKSYDVLLQSLKAKFQWVLNQAKSLGLPPPPELATFRLTVKDKKKKGPTIIPRQETTLSHAFSVRTPHDPATGAWNMDT